MLPSEYLKQGWTKNNLARDKQGNSVSEYSCDATQWCIIGAYNAAFYQTGYSHRHRYEIINELAQLINEKLFGKKVNIFKRIKNKIKYREVGKYKIISYWNDSDCNSQSEAIEIMIEAERRTGITNNLIHSLVKLNCGHQNGRENAGKKVQSVG